LEGADICQVVIDPETDVPIKQLVRYAEDGTFYLLSYTPTEHFSQADYIAAETVAKLITLLADKDLVSLIHIVSGLHAEVRYPCSTMTCSPTRSSAPFPSRPSRSNMEFPPFRRAQDRVGCDRQSPLLPVLTLRPLFPTLSPSPHAAKSEQSGHGCCRHQQGLRVNKVMAVAGSYA